MDKRILGIVIPVFIIITVSLMLISPSSEIETKKNNEKIGLVINSPSSTISLQQLDEIFTDASSSGIGRSNVYLFWNMIEPDEGEFDWSQSDIILGLNEKNNNKVTLYLSIINGKTLGPFPNWIGKPPVFLINEDKLVNTLDSILSRYHIIDSIVIAGETESQFRYNEQNIPVYKELFFNVYDEIKEKHPNVKIGNSFALHQVINKNLEHIVTDLAIGDFTAFSYTPTDTVNEIIKTPEDAINDLNKIFDILPNKKIAFFEIGWSTSEFVGGNNASQEEFIDKLFSFYTENESKIEFLTWYRLYDQEISSCVTNEQNIGGQKITVGGSSSMGTSEYVIERLNQYNCNAGLIDVSKNSKLGWTEFEKQIQILN
jgi:hypothetical protein|tara:strand:+ start:57 stop:1172 length:1116 start_codon:yes stop_codon:yes gene_type:complete